MYSSILKHVEKNAEGITHAVLEELHARPGALHYTLLSNEVISDRISQVVRDVCERLERWLSRNEPKCLWLARYAELGAARCMQSMPLEEVAAVFFMIKKEVCRTIGTQKGADHADAHDQPARVMYAANLLFAGILHSFIAGYRNELAVISDLGQLYSSSPAQVLTWRHGKIMSPAV